MITFRAAAISDIPAILPLMEQLGYPASEEEIRSRLEKFTQKSDCGVVVACLFDKAVGWVAWSKTELFVSNKSRFQIEGLIIDKHCRGMGIGKKLIEHVESIAREFSPSIIDLTSGLRRAKDGTHEFYKKLGYRNEGHMAKLYLRKEI